MTWWSVSTITEVSGEPLDGTSGYVNSDNIVALIPTSFYDTPRTRTVWYNKVIGANVPAGTFIDGQYLTITDARTAAQDWCGGRND